MVERRVDVGALAAEFVDAINSRNIEHILGLMTSDHVFTDSGGNWIQGREALREAWRTYFSWFPDYRIAACCTQTRGDIAVIVGASTGTLSEIGRQALRGPDGSLPPEESLQGPAVWTARERDGLIAEWRVYEDTPPLRKELGLSS